MNPTILLLSIRPKYAMKVFNGTKKVELRRIKPKLNNGDIVLVYVSSPIKQLWGSFKVENIVEKPIDELWSLVEKKAGLSKEEFYEYYIGQEKGYGIFFQETEDIHHPINLDEIKKRWKDFTPPQSYRYVTHTNYEQLVKRT